MAQLGLTTQGANTLSSNAVFYQKLVAPEDMTITSLSGWFEALLGSPDTSFKIALYDDNSGVPDNLLFESAAQLLPTGTPAIYTEPVSPNVLISNGVTFWIASAQFGGASNRLGIFYDSGGVLGDSRVSNNGTSPVVNMPDPANSATDTTNIFSMFATYSPPPDVTVETITFDDTVASAIAHMGMIEEGIAFDDTTASLGIFNSAASETLGLDDTQSVMAIIGASTSEDITFDDSTSGVNMHFVSTQEDVTFDDTVSASATLVAAVDEDLLLNDIINTSLILSPSVVEDMTLDDSATANLTIGVTVSDLLTLSDAPGCIKELNLQLAESLTLSDIVILTIPGSPASGSPRGLTITVSKKVLGISLPNNNNRGSTNGQIQC